MRISLLALVLAAVGTLTAVSGQALACGPETDCLIGKRTYRIRMPEGHEGRTPVGAIVFMHGYRGTAAGIMKNASLGRAVSDLGLALVAPKSASLDWDIPNSPSQGSLVELDFFDSLVADISEKFPIDTGRMMAAGFSAGGMMTWELACNRGGLFAGFAPIAGTFWAPVPESCPSGPVHLLHVHGTDDDIVPLQGRPIASTAQGDVHEALALFAEAGAFGPPDRRREGALDCERRTNAGGKLLELCLHGGGHSFKTEYVTRAWAELEEAGAFD